MNCTILISAKQGGGKTTTANAIVDHFNKHTISSAHNLIFANTIYQMHNTILDILESKGIKVERKKYGALLQFLGTQFGRETDFGPEVGIDPNIWVKCLLGEINNLIVTNPATSIISVVSDCRFKNEFDLVHGFKVRLEASRDVRKARCDGWRDNETHQSETDLDEYAKDKKFHLYLNTETTPIEECVNQVITGLKLWAANELDLENPIGYDSVKHLY